MAKKFTWKVWLRLNLLTKEVENDYVAEVSTTGKTLRYTQGATLLKDPRTIVYELTLTVA
jgi:hypothetical protein